MKRIIITLTALAMLLPLQAAKKIKKQESDREYWCALAYKMAQPVLENMAKGELQKNMKTEFSPSFDNRYRSVVYMETFGRLMQASPLGSPYPMTTPQRVSNVANFVSGHLLPIKIPLTLPHLIISVGARLVRTW